ncbi:GDSL esterase/lipase At5g37690-like [Prunus avium]|uniref:GDSL esterase/lipase At5g37690-like n=1 Tax=Prunus avium TaxID=42229 RepID=A0A6P5U2P7_PRUAV|nr:GDSL esterase/lipase At5g37690-like [Prunus avium]
MQKKNNYMQYSLAKSNYPWYGVDYAGGQATGRFTNGRTIGDIISEKFGIPSPPPYLSVSQNDDALLEGISCRPGILNDTGLYFIQRLSFDDQIQNFNKTKEAIKAKIGGEAAAKLCSEAVYFIGIGSNDYVNNYLQPFLADGQQYTYDEFVELLITTLEGQFTRLYQLGARKMVFHGRGELVSFINNAPRVSGTLEPCGASIAARIEVVSPRPASIAAQIEELSLRPASIAARIEVVSPRPASIVAQIEELSLRPASIATRIEVISPRPASIAAKSEELSLRPASIAARIEVIEVVSPRSESIVAQIEELSLRPASIATRIEVVSPRPARMELTEQEWGYA